MSMYVCLLVCLSVCLTTRLTWKPHSRTSTFMHVAYGRSSVIFWRRCDTLCTSGFCHFWRWRHVNPLTGQRFHLDLRSSYRTLIDPGSQTQPHTGVPELVFWYLLTSALNCSTATRLFPQSGSVTAETTASIPTEFCWTVKTKYWWWRGLGTRGEVCYLRLSCYTNDINREQNGAAIPVPVTSPNVDQYTVGIIHRQSSTLKMSVLL